MSEPAAPARSFQTGRQIGLYRAGKRVAPGLVPASPDVLLQQALARWSPEVTDWINGGAGSEDAISANRAAFSPWRIVPRMLVDISERDCSVELFGKRLPAPVILAPVGVQGLLHPQGELASARAAATVGLPFTLSTVASHTIEQVAQASGKGPRWYQLYWPKDSALAESFIARAERAGYEAIVVTLDTQVLGWRERNLDLGYLPFLQGLGLANYLSDPVFRASLPVPPEEDIRPAVERYLEVFSDLRRTWNDIAWLRKRTRLPIVLKGIQHPDDAQRCLDVGVDGIVVSNHGGRQVDGGIATLDALPRVVDVVQNRIPVLMDGGIRRGADIAKALALGARAVLIGRLYLWALTVGGEQGVLDTLTNLVADLDLTCALSGKPRARELNRSDLLHIAS